MGACSVAYWLLWFRPNPPSGWITLIYALWIIFVSGYFLWRADHLRLIPQLDVIGTRFEDMQIALNEHLGEVRTFCQLVPKCKTESPVYECTGHLMQVRRWSRNAWEITDLGPLTLRWGNVQDNEITLHPGAENVLNVFYIRHSDRQVCPYVDADITWEKVYSTFIRRAAEEMEAYQFDICLTYSQRVNGNLESVKPVNVCLEVQLGNDPYKPHIELHRK
jgi:hypothetical protein